MCLVKSVGREGNNDVPQSLNRFLRVPVIDHSLAEALELLVQNFLLLLTHGLTQNICLAQRVACQLLGNLHDLFLVDDQTKSRSKNVFEWLRKLGVNRGDLLTPVLTQRVIRMGICTHGPRAIQRTDSRDVFEVVGLHELEKIAHTTAIKLEDTQSVSASQ